MNDALCNEVVLGNKYGYANTDTVFIGRAISFSKTRVTLVTLSRRMFRYGKEDNSMLDRYPPAPTVSVWSHHLFPIAEKNTNDTND